MGKGVRNYILEISVLILGLGIFLTIIGVYGVFYESKALSIIKDIIDRIGDWDMWCIILGPFLIIVGGWYTGDTVKKTKEFEELINTTSKAKFIRNLDRLEELAVIYLTEEHERRVVEKKKEMKIKTI